MSDLIKKIKNANNLQNASLAKEIRKYKHYEDELNRITSFLDIINANTALRMWYVKNNIKEILKCKECNKILFTNKTFCPGKCYPTYYNKNKTADQIINKAKAISEHYHSKSKEEKEIIKNNRKQTFIKKYGVEHNFLIPGAVEKIEDKNLKKFGFKRATQNETIKEKIKKTNNERYGSNSPSTNPDIRIKINNTYIEKYGIETAHHLKYKEYILPSGKKIKYQGYENKAFDILIKKYNEIEFITNIKEINVLIGKILYKKNNKLHKYFPDIYIKKENKIIEVKSWYTFNLNKEVNLLKRQACLDKGMIFEFWIFDNDNNLTIIEHEKN